ncbi:MAG: flagellar FlbD family protein [Oscillospiraceae bacterium]|jgi:flagellar protein FlbD
MIKLTRFDGSRIIINENYIETITEAPDTIITLQNGHVYVVKEDIDELLRLCVMFKQSCLKIVEEK